MGEIKDIPKHWEVKKLGEVCSVVYGKGLPVKELKQYGFPVFGANGIIGFSDKYLFEEPQVLISCRGAASGKINFSPPKCFVTNNSLVLGIKFKSELISTYLYYALSIANKTKLVTGTAQPQVTINNAIEIEIPLPPLPEQQAIVSKIEELFSELDHAKEQLFTAQQQLKVYRQSLLKWAFEGKLTHKNVKDGKLPEGWKMIQVKDVAETYGGYAFKSPEFLAQGKYQVLRMGNVRPGLIRYNESPVFLENIDENVLKKALLQINDVIITQTGTKNKRDYGFTAMIQKPNLLLNQRIASIRFSNEYSPKFFLYFTWTDNFKDQFFRNETGNVGQGNVGMKAITETFVPYPSINIQNQIVSELESKLTVCDKIEETIENALSQAESLRQSILKKAFEGRLIESPERAQDLNDGRRPSCDGRRPSSSEKP